MQSGGSNFYGCALLIESKKLGFIPHSDEFLTDGTCKGDIQLLLDRANKFGGATKELP